MKLSNRFNQEDLERIWAFEYKCFWCNQSGADAFHHILSPSSIDYQKGKFNKSVLNACPLHNFKCHIGNGLLHRRENEGKLLKKVLGFLVKSDYEFQNIDREFYQVYKKVYEV